MLSKRRLGIATLCTLALSLALVVPAFAGGWTTVALDTLPTDTHAGTPLTLGFMVRQHGVTPISNVSPVLTARNAATGETFQAAARQEGPVGHFVVELTFPSGGDWRWSITPQPFPEVELGGVTILPVTAAMPETTARTSPADLVATARSISRWVGVASLLAALCLAIYSQRDAVIRWRTQAR